MHGDRLRRGRAGRGRQGVPRPSPLAACAACCAKHDKPYAIFESFGGKRDTPGEDLFHASEAYLLDNLAKLAAGQRETGCRFDYYSIEFWADYHGDLKRFDPKRFPNGFGKVQAEIARLGMAPALWIDSSWDPWSIGGNPAIQGC